MLHLKSAAPTTGSELFGRVEQAKLEWEATVDALPELILLVDGAGRVLRANRSVETWSSYAVTEVAGRDVHELLHAGCQLPNCQLKGVLAKLLLSIPCPESLEEELYDSAMRRHLSVATRPVTPGCRGMVYGTVVIVRDISEIKQLEQVQKELIDDLDAFAGMVAHDLRSPVGVILAATQVYGPIGETWSEADQRALYELVVRMGHKMTAIIDELLLLVGVRNGEQPLQPLNMQRIVAEALHRLGQVMESQGGEIVLPESWPVVLGHAPWVEEVWVNYLSNGLKYGGTPPRLVLGADELPDGSVRFWVQDYGPGIAPDEQKRLFTPLTRLAATRATGEGLGLSIVRRIIEKLGGQVGLESEGIPGRGSRFYFTLPTYAGL